MEVAVGSDGLSAAVAVLVAVVAPFVVAILVRPGMSPARKRGISGAVSVGLGVIVAVITGQIEGIPSTVRAWLTQTVLTVGIVVSLAQGYYRALKDPVDAVEALTSGEPVEPEPVDHATTRPRRVAEPGTPDSYGVVQD